MSVGMPQVQAPVVPEPSDDELIDQTLSGDRAAYDRLMERHQRAISRITSAILRDEIEADLATQDTFVQAYLNLSTFERRSPFEGWLTRIAVNRSRDILRRRVVRSFVPLSSSDELPAPELIAGTPDPERALLSRQIRNLVDRAVSKLSPKQRVVFCLRHFDDMDPNDIAAALQMQPPTVRVHLHRAIQHLRKELGDLFVCHERS